MKLPPFGKPLKDFLETGQLPDNDIFMYIGDLAWEKGKSSSISRPARTLILPPHHAPERYAWPVANCDILMFETSPLKQEYIEDIAYVLFNHDAKKVTVVSSDMLLTIYKKDF